LLTGYRPANHGGHGCSACSPEEPAASQAISFALLDQSRAPERPPGGDRMETGGSRDNGRTIPRRRCSLR
jgi:hypothetical protein